MQLKHAALTNQIIGAYYEVYNQLGYGFLEKVYENAMAHLLRERGLKVEQQRRLKVYFNGHVVGDYFADMIVNDKVILELKAAEEISKAHTAQLMNYLKATRCEVGLLLNFGPKPAFERRYFRNANKPNLKKNPRESAQSAQSAVYPNRDLL